jgi:hypothetical protein
LAGIRYPRPQPIRAPQRRISANTSPSGTNYSSDGHPMCISFFASGLLEISSRGFKRPDSSWNRPLRPGCDFKRSWPLHRLISSLKICHWSRRPHWLSGSSILHEKKSKTDRFKLAWVENSLPDVSTLSASVILGHVGAPGSLAGDRGGLHQRDCRKASFWAWTASPARPMVDDLRLSASFDEQSSWRLPAVAWSLARWNRMPLHGR